MGGRIGETKEQSEGAVTLGDLLYANKTLTPAAEADWVFLLQAIAAGDLRALHALYQRSHRIVFTLIMRITANRETAEELTLDVFHDVWRRAAHYDATKGTVVGWIMNQARSRAIDRVRFEQRKKRSASESGETLATDSPVAADEALGLRDRERVLSNALQTLTSAERRTIETAYFADLSYAETAARLNQPIGTVKTRIRSALEKLRGAIERPDVEP